MHRLVKKQTENDQKPKPLRTPKNEPSKLCRHAHTDTFSADTLTHLRDFTLASMMNFAHCILARLEINLNLINDLLANFWLRICRPDEN